MQSSLQEVHNLRVYLQIVNILYKLQNLHNVLFVSLETALVSDTEIEMGLGPL